MITPLPLSPGGSGTSAASASALSFGDRKPQPPRSGCPHGVFSKDMVDRSSCFAKGDRLRAIVPLATPNPRTHCSGERLFTPYTKGIRACQGFSRNAAEPQPKHAVCCMDTRGQVERSIRTRSPAPLLSGVQSGANSSKKASGSMAPSGANTPRRPILPPANMARAVARGTPVTPPMVSRFMPPCGAAERRTPAFLGLPYSVLFRIPIPRPRVLRRRGGTR